MNEYIFTNKLVPNYSYKIWSNNVEDAWKELSSMTTQDLFYVKAMYTLAEVKSLNSKEEA